MHTFLDLNPSLDNARFVIVPVPYEKTTSYGKGASKGPHAIIDASHYLESFDLETKKEVLNIYTLKRSKASRFQGSKGNKNLIEKVKSLIAKKKIPVILGGEHSITGVAIRAFRSYVPELSVLQIDAHGDLRDALQNDKWSHGSVMRRVLEICPATQVGIRDMSKEGYQFAKKSKQINNIFFAKDIVSTQGFGFRNLLRRIISTLKKNVYITIDVDGFDPSVFPATGTPEPGGLSWNQGLDILKEVCRQRNVIGFDLMELSPQKNSIVSDYAAAKLVYKIISFI